MYVLYTILYLYVMPRAAHPPFTLQYAPQSSGPPHPVNT
jgi:hypothetical protein